MYSIIDSTFLISFFLALIGWIFSSSSSLTRYLHLLQLEDYDPLRMLKSLIKHPSRLSLAGLELIGIVILLAGFLLWLYSIWQWHLYSVQFSLPRAYGIAGKLAVISIPLGYLFWTFGCLWRTLKTSMRLKAAKKRLVMTARAKRIFLIALLFSVESALGAIYLAMLSNHHQSDLSHLFSKLLPSSTYMFRANGWVFLAILPLVAWYVIERIEPIILTITVGILKPVESLIQRRYISEARDILKEMNPLVVGITGSYGKTGTKEMLAAMLAEKYNVLSPPGSYNTLMGITRVIRERLRPYHEVFVVEMGAYRIGSIDKLCKLTKPKHGILTIIGVQHLERFKSRQAIQQAKGELVRALPPDGIAVLNGDDPLCREIGDRFNGEVVYFSLDENQYEIPTVQAKEIRIDIQGSDFSLAFPDGEELSVHLPLLGRGAVVNATAAATLAERMSVPKQGIVRALSSMPQVRHRLEAVKGEGGVTIIDDAYNSNPVGAANALEVLSQATSGRRILVTPGMIELGELEEEANYNFGRQAAEACDLAVLVGVKRIEPIRRGLIEAGFEQDNIWVVPTLNDGLELLKDYLKPGDTMLLENDLPDQYELL